MSFNLNSPKITLLYAGIMGLFYVALTLNVIRLRRSKLVGIGHGENPECPLFRAVRIHGNFSEFVPMILILMTLDEMTGRNIYFLHAMGVLLFIGRVGHYLGITKTHKGSPERIIGMMLTFSVLIALSGMLIFKGLS